MRRPHRAQRLVPSVLVSSLAAIFGVALLQATTNLAILISGDDTTGSSGTVAILLAIVAMVFIVISVYVAAIVTANTFATVIVGRTRTIALRRLIGATARQERRSVAREGIVVGLIGGAIGLVLGTIIPAVGFAIGEATGAIPSAPWNYLQPVVLLPVVGVVLTTWLASWIGSRKVLTVSPMQATGASTDASMTEIVSHRGKRTASLVIFLIGTALLVLGILVGFASPLGVLIGLVGGIVSFTALATGRRRVHATGSPSGWPGARPQRGGPSRCRERHPVSGAQLAHDDRPRDRRHARHDVRRGDVDATRR